MPIPLRRATRLVVLAAAFAACQSVGTLDRTGSLSGRVVGPGGAGIAGASVSAGGAELARSGADGSFRVRGLGAADRLAVTFAAPGHVPTTRIVRVLPGRAQGVAPVRLRPRAPAVAVDAARGGRVAFGEGSALTIPPGVLVDAAGLPVRGAVAVSVTYLDVTDPAQLGTAPGDFTARSAGRAERLESFGMFNVDLADGAGRPVSVAAGSALPVALRAPRGRTSPASVGLYAFESDGGVWVRQGELRLDEALVYSGSVTRGGDWNADDPVETTCITVRVVSATSGAPMANVLVTATGVGYASSSQGYSSSNGLVCLLVKRNAVVEISGWATLGGSDWATPNPPQVQTPGVQAGAAECGNSDLCPLVTTIQMDLV